MMSWALAMALAVTAPADEVLPPRPESIMAVPADMQALLRARVLEVADDPADRLPLLLTLMSSDERGMGLRYEEDATLTVEQAYRQKQANCLTYTLLFLALARRAGITAHPQEIDETLSWQQQGDIVYRSNHVNAMARSHSQWQVIDVASGSVIARHPPHRISEDRLLAQYYNNRAAWLMGQNQLQAALRHADMAIDLDPKYPVTWSNTGVIRLRSGDLPGAERAYLRALALDPMHASALSNLDSLYRRLGQPERAEPFRHRLEKVQRLDPFHQFMLALGYARRGENAQAIDHYRRAIRLQGDEPRFYLGLASAYLATGNQRSADRALRRALASTKDELRRTQYRAALEKLRTTGQL